MKSLVKLIKQTFLLSHEILYIENGLSLIRILNCEYAILSLVIPKDITTRVILLCNLTFASNVLYKNIFLILSDLSTKKYLDICLIALSNYLIN